MNGTNENEHEYDTDAVAQVDKVIKKAWEEIERVAADERYKDAHKAEQIRDIAGRAIAEAEIVARQEIAMLDSRAADLAARARRAVSPPPEMAPVIGVMIEYIRARARGNAMERAGAVNALWRAALETRDVPLLRALEAVGPAYLNGDHLGDLLAQTERVIAPPEVLKARRQLLIDENTRKRINGAVNAARQQMLAARADKGKVRTLPPLSL